MHIYNPKKSESWGSGHLLTIFAPDYFHVKNPQMQTIVYSSDSYTNTDNVVFPVTDVKMIPQDVLSKNELEYIRYFQGAQTEVIFLQPAR